MPSVIKWRQAWNSTPGIGQGEIWSASWTEAFSGADPVGGDPIASVGHLHFGPLPGIGTIELKYTTTKALGAVTLAAVGHAHVASAGFGYPTDLIPALNGTVPATGHTTITGGLGFDSVDSFSIDPPLMLPSTGHMTLTATIGLTIGQGIGTGLMQPNGHLGFSTVSFGYLTQILKQLFSVTLPMVGRTVPSATIESSTVKEIGTGLMDMSGHSTIIPDNFQIEAPPAFVHPIGDAQLFLIGGITTAGDPQWHDWIPHDMGSGAMDMVGHPEVSVLVIFFGGDWPLLSSELGITGHMHLTSNFSNPEADKNYPSTEAVAIYEGYELQEAEAQLESGDVVIE